MRILRRPLTWALAVTLVGLVSAPAAHYHGEGAVFVVGGIALVAMELGQRPSWRGVLVWGWLLDATLLTMAGLMFRVTSAAVPSGITTLALCTVVGFGAACAVRGNGETAGAPSE